MLTLDKLIERLGDRNDITLTLDEYEEFIALALDNPLIFDPAVRMDVLQSGVIGWLPPDVTGRDRNVAVRVPDFEGCSNNPLMVSTGEIDLRGKTLTKQMFYETVEQIRKYHDKT
jgi:hypothetical protein